MVKSRENHKSPREEEEEEREQIGDLCVCCSFELVGMLLRAQLVTRMQNNKNNHVCMRTKQAGEATAMLITIIIIIIWMLPLNAAGDTLQGGPSANLHAPILAPILPDNWLT